MVTITTAERIKSLKSSLLKICHDSGIFAADNVEDVYYDDLIESGIIDSMGVVCLQDQIETHYRINISIDQFVAELHTLDKLVNYLAGNTDVQVAA